MQPLDRDDLEANYERFIAEVVETGIVWGLENEDGWALCPSVDNEEIDVMPFWSERAFAEALCCDEWEGYKPQALDLEEFLDDWLPGLHEDVVLVGINWTDEMEGIEVQPLDLAEEIEDELESFQQEQA